MADLMMRMAGRGDDGLAKAIRTDRGGAIKNTTGYNFYDKSITVTNNGFHLFGETVGRGHQRILNISDFTDLMITVELEGGSSEPGALSFLFFDESGRVTSGADPKRDESLIYEYDYTKEKGRGFPKGKKESFTSFEYSFLDVSNFQGIAILFSSMVSGSTAHVKITGGM